MAKLQSFRWLLEPDREIVDNWGDCKSPLGNPLFRLVRRLSSHE
jgi:hypothetical protein